MVDVSATGPLKDYGLTELFSENSEPPFDQFPLAEFKKLFPEGTYLFLGQLIDGTLLRSELQLTHGFPSGPASGGFGAARPAPPSMDPRRNHLYPLAHD